MRKKIWIPVIVLTMGLLVSCENQNIPPAESTESNTAADSAAMTEPEKDSMPDADSEKELNETLSEESTSQQTEQDQLTNYLEALSEEELEAARSLAEKFYTEEFPYDLISLEPADNTDFLYHENASYEPGTIIIFMAETTHAGEGTYRKIVFVRDDSSSKWQQINEGY